MLSAGASRIKPSQDAHEQGRCKGSGGTVNMCCQALSAQQRCSIRFLTSGNGDDHGVDNECCPKW